MLISTLDKLGNLIASRTEQSQSLARLFIVLLFGASFSVTVAPGVLTLPYVGFVVASIAWFIWTLHVPSLDIRKAMSMVLDHGMISCVLYILGDNHMSVFLLYFWVILGNGYRFGATYSLCSTAISLMFFWVVVIFSPEWGHGIDHAWGHSHDEEWWSSHVHYGIELSVVHIMLSLFIHRAIKNLQDVAARAETLADTVLTERDKAQIDPLTGLYNREKMTDWLQEAHAIGRHVGILFLDLDKFKDINDEHGHQAGDDILINIGKRLMHSTRRQDLVCRYAGDEFIIIVNDESKPIIQSVADRVIESMNRPFRYNGDGKTLPVTGSIGIAVLGIDGSTIKEAIHNADVAMYQAKRRGRNRAAWYGEDSEVI